MLLKQQQEVFPTEGLAVELVLCSTVDLLDVHTESRVKPSALLAWWRRNAADMSLVESGGQSPC